MSIEKNIILASTSPRRRELLQQIGAEFVVCPSQGDESTITKDEFPNPRDLVLRKAMCKGADVVKKTIPLTAQKPNELFCVIACDSIVVESDSTGNTYKILEKPRSHDQCVSMMRSYVNSNHTVLSGVEMTLIKNGSILKSINHVGACEVYFSNITEEEIQNYANTREPYDKAGGYGIQATAARWISKVEGDYYSIVGLPLQFVSSILAENKLL